ncbi:DUF2281 domain-containing protein [Methylovulum miyakonense]|uniref:DUF2281 domain-containing protein n=1 Tax=Methylovulum miyakonense TaxID=645578 RepID=UPI000A03CD4A|nr:DUF2281 domain-containing protein [Methylovulum miyakonense]
MMNTAEQIYQNVQEFPESLALEVLHFVEFLKSKNSSINELVLERKIQQGIEQAENGLGVTLDDAYVDNLNQRVQQRLAANQKN